MFGTLSTAIASVTAILDEECVISGRSAAYCNYTYVGTSSGSTTSTSYTTIITGSLYYEYPVSVTAGAEKLSAAVQTSVSGGAVPSASSPTGVVVSGCSSQVVGKISMFYTSLLLLIHWCLAGLEGL